MGSIWRPTYPLVLPTALAVIGALSAAGAGTGLKGLGAAHRSLRAAIITSIMYVLFSLTGAVVGGTTALF